MAYSAGMLNKRITIARRAATQMGDYGRNSGVQKYEVLGTFWAAETWNKGVKALHEGAVDAYDTVMFRMRYNASVDRWCMIQYHGRWYEIQTLNGDYHENQLQITAIERSNQQVTIVEPEPSPAPEPAPDPDPDPEPTDDESVSDGSTVGNDENIND